MHMRAPGVNPAIFRAYDIRGIYPDELNERAAYLIARAFVHQISAMQGKKNERSMRIVVSADARLSSPVLKEAFLRGLLEEGVYVIDAGLTTTPMHTFVVNRIGADGGAMITASHNPAQFNGIKLTGPHGAIGEGSGMEEMAQMAARGIFEDGIQKGSVREENFLPAYVDFLASQFPSAKQAQMNIAFDAGNGMTGLLLRPLIAKFLGIHSTFLHDEIDMSFPNHEANPVKPENIVDLQEEVGKGGYSFGAAFDGDGDRAAFIDEKGAIIPGDLIIAFFAKRFIQKEGDAIVYEVRSSRVVKEEIERAGGKPILARAGHSFIKAAMRTTNAVFGGETSGHYMFRDFFFAESALLAFLVLLDIMTQKKERLSALVAPLRRYAKLPEINFIITDKESAMDRVAAAFSDAEISYLDGVTVSYADWWCNLRPSNTENLLRLNIEATTEPLLEEKKQLITRLILSS